VSIIDTVIQVAANQVGYKEGPNNQSKYGAWYGLDHQPWCAMFVSWVFAQAGLPNAIPGGKFAACGTGKRAFANVNRLYAAPQIGDLVFFSWNNSTITDHVGIVTGVVPGGVQTIEGNTNTGQGDGVWRRTRTSGIVGYGRPNWPATTQPAAPPPAGKLPVTGIWDAATSAQLQTLLKQAGATLIIDGEFGPNSARALQKVCGTGQDGKISGQPLSYRRANQPGWHPSVYDNTVTGGSTVIRALAKRIEAKGINTAGTSKDGVAGPGLCAGLQTWLNTGGRL